MKNMQAYQTLTTYHVMPSKVSRTFFDRGMLKWAITYIADKWVNMNNFLRKQFAMFEKVKCDFLSFSILPQEIYSKEWTQIQIDRKWNELQERDGKVNSGMFINWIFYSQLKQIPTI